jgi:tetratricopeptide (TPR) repeat protein
MTAAYAPAAEAAPAPPPGEDLRAGLELRRAGDLAGAAAAFERSARAADPTALWLVGLMRFEVGDASGAERLVARAAALRPTDAQTALTLANLRQHRGDARGAAAAYAHALTLAPQNAAALIGHAQCLLACGDHDAALGAAQAAIAAAPQEAEAHLALAAALVALKRPHEAAEAYRAAGDLAPDNPAAWLGQAVQLLQVGETQAALAATERAAALDAAAPLAWLALGTAHRRLGRLEPAADALQRAVALAPNLRGALLGLGLIEIELDRLEAAEGHLRAALGLDPDDKEAHAALSTVYCATDRFTLARDHAERALTLDRTLLTARLNFARALDAEGRAAEARAHRDVAYGERNFFVAEGPPGAPRVLVLATATLGNTPDRHLLPQSRFTRCFWFIQYATAAQMAALPPFDAVFNGIGDADETGPTAANVARFLKTCAAPILNAPYAVERTRRELAPALFGDIDGLVVPACARLTAATLAELGLVEGSRRGGTGAPFIVRPVGSHGGSGARLITGTTDMPPSADRDAYVTAFHDARSFDGLFRKYRMIFVGGEPHPYHLAIGPSWLVHYETSGTAAHAQRRAEELRFLEDPETALGHLAMNAVREVGRRLALDLAGIDFAVLPDGRALFFEANATMLVHPEDTAGPLAHKNPHIVRILEAFWARLAATTRGANRANVASSEKLGGAAHAP